MARLPSKSALAAAAAFTLASCGDARDALLSKGEPSPNTESARVQNAPKLGLMTSLPIYWPLDADMESIASGAAAVPWQRKAIEQRFELVPLDTLSPIPGLSPESPETDPLEGLEYLAVIQPRGLSAADNVALDQWVREGGHLLIALDPLLTGEYELPLGDPRRPVDEALIPPVIKRWGLGVSFDPAQDFAIQEARLGVGHIWLSVPGVITREQSAEESCEVLVSGAVARCRVDEGQVTIVADAASFEHSAGEVEGSVATGPPLLSVLDFAFEPQAGSNARRSSTAPMGE